MPGRDILDALESWQDILTGSFDEKSMCAVDVSEIYNPAIFTSRAKHMGMYPGTAFDLAVQRDDGSHWDFDIAAHRRECLEIIDREEPELLVGAPFCGPFSSLMNWNWETMQPDKREEVWKRACMHVKFSFQCYEKQRKAGRWFLHEHPRNATSWKLEDVQRMCSRDGVMFVTGDQCVWGQWTIDVDKKWGLVKSRRVG